MMDFGKKLLVVSFVIVITALLLNCYFAPEIMGFGVNLLVVSVVIAITALLLNRYFAPEIVIPKDTDEGQSIPNDSLAIKKFVVNVPDTALQDLKTRLDAARFVESIEGTNFRYGFNSNYLKQVVEFWKTKFDWKRQEKELNKYNHYTTEIEGINVHFVHAKSTKQANTDLPLLLIHGWPGSFYEFYKSIPLLIEPVNDVAFEIVVPSIPGYGFSEAPHQEGFNAIDASRLFVKLMDRLGHKKFFVQGGDWGAIIGTFMSYIYPKNVRGFHTNMPGTPNNKSLKFLIGAYVPSLIFDDPVNDYKKIYPFANQFYYESGYMHIQSTKPDTVGAALHDSPVGLAAYILEKFSTWTNSENINKPDGGLTENFTLTELLTNIMIYWINNPTSSMRFYKEFSNSKNSIKTNSRQIIVKNVPVGVADFPHEILRCPKALAKDKFENLVHYTDMPQGGHFAAFEQPKLMTDDIRKFVKTCLINEQNVKE